jgi:hypothetical protein
MRFYIHELWGMCYAVNQRETICVRPRRMRIHDFPLIWRWTDSRHSMLPEPVLSQLQPLGAQEARLAFEHVKSFQQFPGIKHTADVSDGEGCSWLRNQHGGLADIVTISWSIDWALRTSWQIFTEYWSDFCYPFDDVTVWPDSERWILFYHHEDRFEFIQRRSA